MKTLLTISLSLLLLTACASTSKIKKTANTFVGGEVYATETFYLQELPGTPTERPNAVKIPKGQVGHTPENNNVPVKVRFHRVTRPNQADSYTIGVIYTYDSNIPMPANLGGKNSLKFKIDGKSVALSTDDRSGNKAVRSGGLLGLESYNTESVLYRNVPTGLIRDLANAKNVVVLVQSDYGDLAGTFSPVISEALANLQGRQKSKQAVAE